MFFSGWEGLLRTLVVGVLAYAVLIIMLRISGKRTLSKMNAFDLVVTVALGSTLSTILLDENVALAEGSVAFAVLIALQYAITWTSVRVGWVRRLATGKPVLLAYRGVLLPSALRAARVTEDEVLAAVRSEGHSSLVDVLAVVLETEGSLSVVKPGPELGSSSLAGVEGRPERPHGAPASVE